MSFNQYHPQSPNHWSHSNNKYFPVNSTFQIDPHQQLKATLAREFAESSSSHNSRRAHPQSLATPTTHLLGEYHVPSATGASAIGETSSPPAWRQRVHHMSPVRWIFDRTDHCRRVHAFMWVKTKSSIWRIWIRSRSTHYLAMWPWLLWVFWEFALKSARRRCGYFDDKTALWRVVHALNNFFYHNVPLERLINNARCIIWVKCKPLSCAH